LEDLNLLVNQIIKETENAKSLSQSITNTLEIGYIPNETVYGEFCIAQEQLHMLQQEINVYLKSIKLTPLGDNHSIIQMKEEFITYGEAAHKMDNLKNEMIEVAETFHRITSEMDSYMTVLEEEKELVKKYKENLGSSSNNHELKINISALKPAHCFVKGVMYGAEVLGEEEYDLISDAFDKMLLKGLSLRKYHLVIDDIPMKYIEDCSDNVEESTKIDEEIKEGAAREVNDINLDLRDKTTHMTGSEVGILLEENISPTEISENQKIMKMEKVNEDDFLTVTSPSKPKFSVTVFTNEAKKMPSRLFRLSALTMIPLMSESQFLDLIKLMVSPKLRDQILFAEGGFEKDEKKGYFVSTKVSGWNEPVFGLSQVGWTYTQKETLSKIFDRHCPFKVMKISKPQWANWTMADAQKSLRLFSSYLSFLRYLEQFSPDEFSDHIFDFKHRGRIISFRTDLTSLVGEQLVLANLQGSDTENLLKEMSNIANSLGKGQVTYILCCCDEMLLEETKERMDTLEGLVIYNTEKNKLIFLDEKKKTFPSKEYSLSETVSLTENEKELDSERVVSSLDTSVEITVSEESVQEDKRGKNAENSREAMDIEETGEVSSMEEKSPAEEVQGPLKKHEIEHYSTSLGEKPSESRKVLTGTESVKKLAELLLPMERISDVREVAHRMTEALLEEDRVPLALVWAKSLSKIYPEEETYYRKILLATGMNLEEKAYDSASIGILYSEALSHDDESVDADYLFMLSVIIRGLFRPDIAHDYTLLSYADQIVKSHQIFFDEHASVKQVVGILKNFLDVEPNGFAERTFAYIRSASQTENSIRNIQHAAKQLRNESLETNIGMIEVKKMLKKCLGKESQIHQALHVVENNIQSDYQAVINLFDSFATITHGEVEIDQEMVDAYIDEIWEEVMPKYFRKNTGFSHIGRKKVDKKLKERINVMGSWLSLSTPHSSRSMELEEHKGTISKFREDIIYHIGKSLEELTNSPYTTFKPGINVLMYTLIEIQSYLEKLSTYSPWIFLEFLRTNHIELNRNALPVINPMFNGTRGWEPWRRVLMHILSDPQDLSERFYTVVNDPKETNRDDFGIASLIQNYLRELEGPQDILELDLDMACINAESALNSYIDQFKSDFEMAYMYGSIDEVNKEEMIQLSEDYKEMLLENNNYGFYMRFLAALTNNIKLLAQKRTEELNMQFEDSCKGKTVEEYPIISTIKVLLEKGNIGLSTEYLDNLRQGIRSVDDEISVSNSQDYHMEFLDEYDGIYDRCMSYKGRALRNFIEPEMRHILKNRKTDFTARIRESSENFIRSWPKDLNERNLPEHLFRYFKELGFAIKSCTEDVQRSSVASQNWKTFKLFISPPDKNLDYYNHPISNYGTQATEFFRVICMFGGINANEMIQILSRIDGGIGSNTIILLDNALTKPERRKIAEKYKSSTSWQNSFLLIDQVLTLFLAGRRPEDRIEALLKCTLPYTYYQPYNNDGGFIADEMFFGRKKELASILDPKGSCLVYGGRQLGKTALLLRAKSVAHRPENKEYTVFVNAQNMDSELLVHQISKELTAAGILENKNHTWASLCEELRGHYEKKKYSKLLLLVDEVDDFLSSITTDGYLPLKDLRELRRETDNHFKFVLAGLHNVTRLSAAKEKNSIIPQLGDPLGIKPFSPRDAAQLLKIPLSYLGYSFEDESLISMILLKTNYYPGLLHFFCYTMVQTVSEKYRKYYSAENNPPYILDHDKLKAILFEKDINSKIKEKFFLNLLLDKRYLKIAYVLAYLFMDPVEEMPSGARGYSVEEIKDIGENFEVPYLAGTPDDEYSNLLQEMAELGVLTQFESEGRVLYKFRKYDFSKMFGTEAEICSHLEAND